MSTTELTVIEGGKQTFRTVEVVRQAESDRWAIVEAIQEDIEADQKVAARAADSLPGQALSQAVHDLCSDIADACRGVGADSWKTKTVIDLYRVSIAWPRESRVDGATYGAHERLFNRPDRVAKLQKLVARSSDGRVNRNDVDLWLSTQKPSKVVGFLDAIDKAVRSALISKGKPWSHVAQDDRDEIARRLRIVAEEIQHAEGKFS